MSRDYKRRTLEVLKPAQITEIFSQLDSKDENKRLNEAFAVLQISRRQFEKLHTQQLKIEYLIYKLGIFEFNYYRYPRDLLNLAHKAYGIIFNSHLIQQHVDQYGPDSQGLIELDIPLLLDAEDDGPQKLLRQSLNVSAPKDSGVEPGYLGHQMQDAILRFFQEYPYTNDRLEQIRLFRGNVNALLRSYQKDLERHVVKLTYKDVTSSGMVVPDTEDLARASTMKNLEKRFGWMGHTLGLQIYQKLKTRELSEVNLEAVREVIANDVARAFGMEVQEQHLIKDKHAGGRLKLPLKAKWVEGASLLQPLAGSNNSQSYYVQPVLTEIDGIKYRSNNYIPDLPAHFALLACLGDRDKVGSVGQNLLVRNHKLIGIDFGHAYDGKNPIVSSLNFDFSFHASSFKNYTLFLDAPRSELMQGVLKLARWRGDKIDPAVIESYGPDFVKTYEETIPYADQRVFDDYIRKFKALLRDDPLNKLEYERIIYDLEEKKAIHMANREIILRKLRPFIGLPAPLIDTLENFEKLWAANLGHTSMRSPDGTVMLRHLRMTENNPVVEWKTDACDKKNVVVEAVFANPQSAAHAVAVLQAHQVSVPGLKYVQQDAHVKITFPNHQLSNVAEIIREDNIKACYHPEDNAVADVLMGEQNFCERVKVLEKYGLGVEVRSAQGRNIQVSITPNLSLKNDALMTEAEARRLQIAVFLVKGLAVSHCPVEMKVGGVIDAEIPQDKLSRVENFIKVFDACYQHYDTARAQLNQLSANILKEEGIYVHFILKLIYHQGEFKFHLMVRSPGEDISLDLVTDSDILQAIDQLKTIKDDVHRGYEQYKLQKCIVLLEQQVGGLSQFLETRYSRKNASPSKFQAKNPALVFKEYLERWVGSQDAYSRAALKEMGEAVVGRLQYIETRREENFSCYLEEKGMLEDIQKSIHKLQLRNELRTEAERTRVDVPQYNYRKEAKVRLYTDPSTLGGGCRDDVQSTAFSQRGQAMVY